MSKKLIRESVAVALDLHHPAGWSSRGSGASYTIDHGRKITTEEDITYAPRHTRPAFNEIQLLVEVVPGHHHHALSRVDVQVMWYPSRSAAEYLLARHFRAVRIDEWIYGNHVRHVRRTFRQRAIIDKLTRVLNGLPASAGPGAIVQADGCPPEAEGFRAAEDCGARGGDLAGVPRRVVASRMFFVQ